MPHIRFATLLDLPDIRRMWMAMIRESPQAYPTNMTDVATADEFTRQAARVLSDADAVTFCLMAHDDAGEAIGFHCFGYQARDLGLPQRIVFCYWIYVIPAYRNSPLVEDLAELAVEHALAQGVTHVEMTRVPGTALRKGLGFEPFEIRSQAPCTLILTRIEERRRRRAKQHGNGLDHEAAESAPPDEEATEEETP